MRRCVRVLSVASSSKRVSEANIAHRSTDARILYPSSCGYFYEYTKTLIRSSRPTQIASLNSSRIHCGFLLGPCL